MFDLDENNSVLRYLTDGKSHKRSFLLNLQNYFPIGVHIQLLDVVAVAKTKQNDDYNQIIQLSFY